MKLSSIQWRTLSAFFLGASLLTGVGYLSSCTKTESTTILTCAVSCVNGGRCENGVCLCPTGYEGGSCQREWSAKFAGVYRDNNGGNPVTLVASTVRPDLFSAENWIPNVTMLFRRVDSLSFKIDSLQNGGQLLAGGTGRINETGRIVSGRYFRVENSVRDTVEFLFKR